MTPTEQAQYLVAKLDDLTALARALVAALAPVEPPAPAPEPPPAPVPPPPPPPPPGDAPTLTHEPLNLSRVVCIDSWHASSRYERFQNLVRWAGPTAVVRIIGINLATGGARIPLGSARYVLTVDGAEAGVIDVAAGATEAQARIDVSAMPEGWRTLRLAGLADGECCPTWFAYVDRGGARPALIPVCTGSYDVTHNGSGAHSWAWVPAAANPPPRPLPRREYPPAALTGPLIGHYLVPGDGGNVNRPSVSQHGIPSTFNSQSYTWLDFINRYPRQHLLDGPRGVGTAGQVTHISIGTGRREDRPDSPIMGNVYATDPWRLMRISETGEVRTLVGWRHKGPPGHWQDSAPSPQLELVGDWSAVPEDRRGCWELWGMAWDSATLAVDAGAATIPEEQGRQPHSDNPACFLADSQHNRILRVEFDGRSHRTPARVTEWLTGLRDPWDVVTWRDEVIVSERQAHRVAAYRRDGALSRVIVERDPSLFATATVDRNRMVLRTGSLDALRAQAVVAPEGLYVLGDWLYIGSVAQALVQRVHLVTGVREPVCLPTLDGNSRFLKIAVSDGTFGPVGTVFCDSWSNNARADVYAYLPDGTRVTVATSSAITTTGYGTAVAVGGGRLYVGTSEEGLKRISARLPTDPPLDHSSYYGARNGLAEYERANHRLLHGPHGFGHWGWPLPQGSDALSTYLSTIQGISA